MNILVNALGISDSGGVKVLEKFVNDCLYVKSEFLSMLWMAFESQSQRDLVVEALNKTNVAMTSRINWIAPDLPLPMRVEKKFLFGLKRILLAWGWQGFETRVDIHARKIFIDNQLVVYVDAHD